MNDYVVKVTLKNHEQYVMFTQYADDLMAQAFIFSEVTDMYDIDYDDIARLLLVRLDTNSVTVWTL